LHKAFVLDAIRVKAALKAGFLNLAKYKEEINSLNVFPVPDGDTGTNMYLTISSAVKEAELIDSNNVGAVVKAASKGALMGARGNSGVILSQLFRGFAQELDGVETMEPKDIVVASERAVQVAYKAVLKPVEGTILTVARAVFQGLKEAAYFTKDINELLNHGILAGEQALEKTPEMLPVLARAGVVDAGGKGLLIILHGIAQYLDGKHLNEEPLVSGIAGVAKPLIAQQEEIGEYVYCTECVIRGKDLSEDNIREEICNLGDSTLVVGSGDIIKIHVHTNNPGQVLEISLKYGTLHDIKIENMLEQNASFRSADKSSSKMKEVGLVSVVAGDGLKEIIVSMGVDQVVEGGQTMNPSTEDILSAVEKLESASAIIIPNNRNIIMAAEQAAKMSKKKVRVIPTKTFPQGMAAMLGYDVNQSLEENYESMMSHFNNVLTGEITYAVRDTQFGEMVINQGDILALLEGDIAFTGKDLQDVTMRLLEIIVNKGVELITVFYGENVAEETAEFIKEEFTQKYPDIEFELYWGGQPLYHFLISAE